jgi:hypothetical protein
MALSSSTSGVLAVIIVIGLLLVTLITQMIRRADRRTDSPKHTGNGTATDAESEDSVTPTFDVVALGADGSGKTVYLASMFHQLRTERHGVPFRLRTKPEDDAELTQVLNRISQDDWPLSTESGRSYGFDLLGGGRTEPLLRFSYYDYAGELIDGTHETKLSPEERETEMTALKVKIEAAQVLLGVIDGHRVADCLNGKDDEHSYLEYTISPMIELLRGGKRAVYLILTKWDMLAKIEGYPDADDNERLEVVARALLAQQTVWNLVEECVSTRRKARLIPVSAVGPAFAELQADNRVHRRPGARRRPVNVEIPLYAVLPDAFRQVRAKLDQRARAEVEAAGRGRAGMTAAQSAIALARFLRSPTGLALRTLIGQVLGMGLFTERLVDMFLDWVAGTSDGDWDEPDPAREAQRRMIYEFNRKTELLVDRLPASDLTAIR